MTPSVLEELTRDQGVDYRASNQRHEEKGWKDMHSLLEKISNSEMLKPVLRFPFVSRGREGLRMKLTLFVSQASANLCDGP